MGFVRKLTGADAAKNQAKAAQQQADIMKQSSEQQAAVIRQNAQQAAQQQTMLAARAAAEAKATDAISTPLERAEVYLDTPTEGSATATARRQRGAFGKTYSSGVNI